MNIYTMKDWMADGSLRLRRGQNIDEEVFAQLRDSVPPTTLANGVFQVGEAYDAHPKYGLLYQTFRKNGNLWQYVGLFMEITAKESFNHIKHMII